MLGTLLIRAFITTIIQNGIYWMVNQFIEVFVWKRLLITQNRIKKFLFKYEIF